MKYNKITSSFISPDVPQARSNKIGIIVMIFILFFVENCLKYDAIQETHTSMLYHSEVFF